MQFEFVFCIGHNKHSQRICGFAQVCIKIIKNNKDFFDQSLDEIKLLKYINSHADPDEKNVVQLFGKRARACVRALHNV